VFSGNSLNTNSLAFFCEPKKRKGDALLLGIKRAPSTVGWVEVRNPTYIQVWDMLGFTGSTQPTFLSKFIFWSIASGLALSCNT